jgi:cell division protein FtsQ
VSGTSTLERPPEAAIDPRIRARRIEVRRHEGRRRLSRLVEVGLVVGVVLAFAAALFTPLLDVDEVTVVGTAHLPEDEVLAAAGIELGAPLVWVDLAAAGERVAALPWVAEVALHRGVDGVISLDVTERAPVASVPTPDGPVAVDREGRVLGPARSTLGRTLVSLDGVARVPVAGGYLPAATGDALAAAAALAEVLPGIVTGLEVDGLVATLAQGGQVRFGDASRLDGKLRSLSTVLGQVDLTCLAVIDLRLPGSPVLTREEGCP